MYFTSIKYVLNSGWCFLCLVLSIQAVGQIEHVKRYEVPLSPFEPIYKTSSFNEKGLLLFRTLAGREANQLELIKLDTALKELWKGYIKIEKKLALVQTRTKEGRLYMLFKNQQYDDASYQVLVIHELKGNYGSYTINNAIPFNPTEFEVSNASIIIGGYLNLRPIVLHYSLINKKTTILPGYFNEPGELTQVKANNNGSFTIIVRARNNDKKGCLWIRTYDLDGQLNNTSVLTPEKNLSLLAGKSIQLKNAETLIAGVYGRYSSYTRGIFLATVNSAGDQHINYYPYGELSRFFNFKKPNREKRIKERIQRQKLKGKSGNFSYRMVVHDIVRQDDQFLFVCEAFNPHYSYSTYSSYGNPLRFGAATSPYLGNQYNRGDYVFDGYQYTHSVVVGFSQERKILWDNCLEMNDFKNMQLDQYAKIVPKHDSLLLLYLSDNLLRTKIIKDSTIVQAKKTEPLKTDNPNEEVIKREGESNALENWYLDYWTASGVQRVRNTRIQGVAFERRVFFINKLRYH